MSEEEQLKLLATDGMLVKRPLVVGTDFVLTGFREKNGKKKCFKLQTEQLSFGERKRRNKNVRS